MMEAQSYINEDVAAELGIMGEKQRVEVNIFNGQTMTSKYK